MTEEWSESFENAQFIMLEGSQENWEGDATARIRECGKVLYIVGEMSAKSKYIQIELDIAGREHKEIYVFPLQEDYEINECLKNAKKSVTALKGEYEGEIIINKAKERVYVLNEAELNDKFQKDSEEIRMILKSADFSDKDIIMQQYKMFVQTSEDLVKRKQSVNTFYVTLNSILLSAIVSVICSITELGKSDGGNVAIYLLFIFLSIMGIIVCCSWITLLKSYGDLNASKMDIIGCIEEHLALKLFDTEWAILSRRIGKKKYKSFTVKEIAVAKIFLALYGLLIIVCCALIFYKIR